MAKAVLVATVPPLMLKTDANPGGLPIETFDALRAGMLKDRSQFYRDLSAPFYGASRPGAGVYQANRGLLGTAEPEVPPVANERKAEGRSS